LSTAAHFTSIESSASGLQLNAQQGVQLFACQLRLAEQPRLAGLKHLNRLEQVLARAEWV